MSGGYCKTTYRSAGEDRAPPRLSAPKPQQAPSPNFECKTATDDWGKAADVLDDISTNSSVVALGALGAAALTSETVFGGLAFGAIAATAEGVSLAAGGASAVINWNIGRKGNAAMTAAGQVIGFGAGRAVEKSVANLAIDAAWKYKAVAGIHGQVVSAMLSCN
ncbi:hypothetical protein [Caulobacter sp. Root487D2Y]|uniref:hypothetical protein n=1 Tax=Caulobacter sp. Root487D2Y TaxID=1736547 RepID=UPI0012E3E3DA|nr:hypothetical protein [Caulobacter sp. Root487D2Y]